ncbi:restriction endonuclease subunit S [Oceanimonas baumannii]|uniref:restriction endonuclease subunit S n=1 Tax=Oceanimonas baumannii TaxID=129578 RepID=UPI003A95D245
MSAESLFPSTPAHWRVTTLGELAESSGGGIQTGPFGSQLHAKDYVDDGIPSIMPKNISIDSVLTDDIARVSPTDIERLAKYKVQTGDIIYSRRGDVEKCARITPREDGWLCGTGCLRVRVLPVDVSPEYLHAYLCHPQVREWIVRHAVGATMPNLNTSILSALPVVVPNRPEMEAISSLWLTISEKLQLNHQINLTLEQMAQAIFKSWFLDFDPVRAKIAVLEAGGSEQDVLLAAMQAISGKSKAALTRFEAEKPEQYAELQATAELFPSAMQDSELGEIPEGWEAGTLNDVAYLNKSSWSKKTLPEELLYVDLSNTKQGVIEVATPYASSEAPSRARRRLSDGDTIIGTVRPGNKSYAFIKDPESHLTGSTGFAVLSPKKSEFAEFVYLAATSEESISHLAHLADGGAYPAVRPDVVSGLSCVIPDQSVLVTYHRLITANFSLRHELMKENSRLAQLRDTLLPKLLSGELNLTEIENAEVTTA